jgi:hypothetical protein
VKLKHAAMSFMRLPLLLTASLTLVAWDVAPVKANDTPVVPLGCAPEPAVYSFTSVARSTRPTNLVSAYITGPGTISYEKSATASVSAAASGAVGVEINAVVAKASVEIGVELSAEKSWAEGFSYSIRVPSGQRRRLRLHQESRSFDVRKQTFNTAQCKYVTAYSAQTANAPRKTLVENWRLES